MEWAHTNFRDPRAGEDGEVAEEHTSAPGPSDHGRCRGTSAKVDTKDRRADYAWEADAQSLPSSSTPDPQLYGRVSFVVLRAESG